MLGPTKGLSFNAAILIECSVGFFYFYYYLPPCDAQTPSSAVTLPLAALLMLGEGAGPLSTAP